MAYDRREYDRKRQERLRKGVDIPQAQCPTTLDPTSTVAETVEPQYATILDVPAKRRKRYELLCLGRNIAPSFEGLLEWIYTEKVS
jgi:hypothetical protein